MLALQRVSYSYKRSEPLITNVDIAMPRGYVTAIVGRNGAGKTTLLKLLYGALSPKFGKLLCDGEKITKDNLSKFHDRCVFVTAEGWAVSDRSANWHLDYFDALYPGFDKNKAKEILEKFHFPMEEADQPVEHLSTGQKMQVQIAIALAKNPDYIIMDEPFANVDPIVKVDMLDMIQKAVERGCGVVLSTHLMEEVEHLTDQVLVMEDGKISGETIEEDEADVFDFGKDNSNKVTSVNQNGDCKRLYQLMQKESGYNVRHYVAFALATVILISQYVVGVGTIFTAFEIFLMFAMVYEFYVKNTQIRVKGVAGMENLPLAEWLRFHKYPIAEYSRFLLKKFIPVWCLYGFVLVISVVAEFHVIRIVYLLLWAVIPPAVMLTEKFFMQREVVSEKNVGKEVVSLLIHGIYHIFFLVNVGTTAFLSAFGILILFEAFIHPKGWSETIPTSMTNSYAWMMIMCMVLLLTFLFAMSNKDEVFDLLGLTKISGIFKIRWILGVVTIAVFVGNLLICSFQYTIFGGDRFVVSDWGNISEYTIDDVSQCHMYYTSEEFHLDLTFEDGKKVKILGNGTYTNNDLWTETYDNDYAYAIELSEELLARDVTPVLDDEDEIREMVRDFEPTIVRDFEKLAELLQ